MRQGFQTGPHSYVEVTHNSYGSRVAGSMCGACFGWVLLLIAPTVLWYNEQNAVTVAQELDFLQNNLVSIGMNPTIAAAGGFASRPVHFSGTITGDVITDKVGYFTVSTPAVKLSRSTEMFQWIEHTRTETQRTNGGGSTTIKHVDYRMEWSSTYRSSAGYRDQHAHSNPSPGMPLEATTQLAQRIAIGDLKPSQEILNALPMQRLFLDGNNVRDRRDQVHILNDAVFLGQDPGRPQVGDLRVRYNVCPTDTQISVIGIMQHDGTVTGAPNSVLPLVAAGTQSHGDMLSARHAQNTLLLWVLRFVGFLLMYFGISICAEPVNVVGDIIPFFGTLLRWITGTAVLLISVGLSLFVIALAWLFARPALSLALFLIGASMVYFSTTQRKRQRYSD